MMPDRKRLYSADSDDSHVKEAQEQRDIINKEASQIDKKCDALEKNRYNEQRVSCYQPNFLTTNRSYFSTLNIFWNPIINSKPSKLF